MSLEQKISQKLNADPKMKRRIKRVYQRVSYTFSRKRAKSGDIHRISPDDGKEYFFGYYDKSPWDITGRYVLCLRANDTWSDVSPREPADILLIDTQENNSASVIGQTRTWNVQQGCMLQWLGPDYSEEIIFNDLRNDKYVSVIKNVFTGQERVIDAPVCSVSADGKFALTLDFSRLYELRPGYGYYNVPEKTKGIALPDAYAIWHIDLTNGNVTPLLKYADFAGFEPRQEMLGGNVVHKVNHIMLSPDGKRFMVLYRWFVGAKKYTRLITCNTDGSDMYLLSDDDMVSHCFWKNNDEILAFENKNGSGAGYYLMKDKTPEYRHLWESIGNDGHPSYSPDGKYIVTDSYPNRKRMQTLKLLREDEENGIVIGRVFAPFRYDNDTRCDLHPRWSRDGKKICFDGAFEGHRGLYEINTAVFEKTPKIKVLFILPSCKKVGPTQQMYNIINHLDRETFEPVLMTIYPEVTDGTSLLSMFTKKVEHIFVPTGKKNVILGRTGGLKSAIEKISPDVIHSLGVFPDNAVSKLFPGKQIITLRNYIYEDYPQKFGKAKGAMLAKLHLYAMKHASTVVACSQSLSEIYKAKLGLEYGYVRNGVDSDIYRNASPDEKAAFRKELGLPENKKIFVYSGQIIERKNQRFLLEAFVGGGFGDKAYLLLLGDGADLAALKEKFGNEPSVDFRGNVTNVSDYLKASDIYVSVSKSEGMPNGVLEAMATGLPVLLSDIDQHKEVFSADPDIGMLYTKDNSEELKRRLSEMLTADLEKMGQHAYSSAHENFDAKGNCRSYERLYKNIYDRNAE